MILNLKYFGRIVEITNLTEEQYNAGESMSLNELRTWLINRYTDLEKESFQIAVNQELKSNDFLIKGDCEVAILPPFAGG